MVGADDVSNGKPHPEGYLSAASKLRVEPSGCVVVEDATAGVEAGRPVGMTTLAVLTTHPADRLPADHQIPDLGSLEVGQVRNEIILRF